MSRTRTSASIASTLLALAATLAAACADDASGADGELGARLATPTTFSIIQPSHADVTGRDQDGASVAVGPLVVEGGSLTVKLDANDDIVVQDFVIELGDVVADEGTLAGSPRVLTDVRVSLGRPLVLDDAWSDGGAGAIATTYSNVRLDWSMIDASTGQTVKLGTQTVTDVEFQVSLRVDEAGQVSARLSANVYGRVFANWGVELTDFAMNLKAVAP